MTRSRVTLVSVTIGQVTVLTIAVVSVGLRWPQGARHVEFPIPLSFSVPASLPATNGAQLDEALLGGLREEAGDLVGGALRAGAGRKKQTGLNFSERESKERRHDDDDGRSDEQREPPPERAPTELHPFRIGRRSVTRQFGAGCLHDLAKRLRDLVRGTPATRKRIERYCLGREARAASS
jgi:hypothetical protein